jgi:hypothetical protein
MSIAEIAAREKENDASLWDDEDYKTIAAKSCILYKSVFDQALGDLYSNWSALSSEYLRVNLTAGALDDHPKWGPIADLVFKSWQNALSRSVGGSGVEVPSDSNLKTFELCKELGLDLSE